MRPYDTREYRGKRVWRDIGSQTNKVQKSETATFKQQGPHGCAVVFDLVHYENKDRLLLQHKKEAERLYLHGK